MSSRCRKSLLFGFTTVAAFLVVTSVAYACTVFKGSMTATPMPNAVPAPGDAGGYTTVQSLGGASDGMTHCSETTGTLTGKIPAEGQPVAVTIAPGTGCSSSSLQTDTYTINWAPYGAQDCMVPGGTGVTLDTMFVNGTGNGYKVVALVPGESRSSVFQTVALCVTSTNPTLARQGNQVTLNGTFA